VSTSYDSISIAPQATKGISHLSGIFAMNEISKVIWKLNSDTDLNLVEKQQYDIMFVLTPGSTNDYEITS